MANKRRQGLQESGELPDPHPHPPKSGGKYEIKIEKAGGTIRVIKWDALYAAHTYLAAIIQEDKYKWLKRDRIEVKGMEISCPDLEAILEHGLTPKEQEWELPEPDASEVKRFRGEKAERKRTVIEEGAKQAAEHRSALNKPKRQAPPPREVPKGMITIAQICEEFKIEPRIARGILRKSDTPKPDLGWMWDKKGADSIKALLRKEIK